MNRSIFTVWLPAAVILVCVIIIANKFMNSSDAEKIVGVEPVAEDQSVTSGDTNTNKKKKSAWQSFWDNVEQKSGLAGSQALDIADTKSGDIKSDENPKPVIKKVPFDREAWENSGSSLEERARNYIKGRDLPQMEQIKVRPMKYQRDFNYEMYKLREKGLAENTAEAWVTVKFEPEMIGEEVTGLKLSDFEARDFLEKNGLENGDVIKQVNGKKIDSPETAFDGMSTIGLNENLTLVIDRGGDELTVDINKNKKTDNQIK